MGGISFEATYEIVVGFDNPGGLQTGAPVKIAGVKVGKVKTMRFNAEQTKDGDSSLVYAHVGVEKRYQKRVRDNAVFYITTQGVLGEQFLAIDPGSLDRPMLEDGSVVRGLDPPRLDRLIAESYDLLHSTVTAMRRNKTEIAELFEGLSKTLKGTGEFFHRNQDRLDRVAENVEKMSEESAVAITHAREKYIDNPAIDRILVNVEHITNASARDVPVLLEQGKSTLVGAQKIVNTFSSDAEIARFQAMLDDIHATTREAKAAVGDAKAIAAHIRRGKGTVGAIVMDEQLFDDLQELTRDLKHNPWKLFWKE
jgi:phospholipid/cholesterol/gamma-HCH transport system substrate-binding protein